MIEIEILKPCNLEAVWVDALPFVKMAASESNGEMCTYAVYGDLLSGNQFMMLVYEDSKLIAILTAGVTVFPTGKRTLALHAIGGSKMDLWKYEAFDRMKLIAREFNCSDMYGMGRRGWAGLLKSEGFTHTHTVMSIKVGE